MSTWRSFFLTFALAIAFSTAIACGAGSAAQWTAQDALDVLHVFNSDVALKQACSGDGGCDPALVRATETANECTLGGMAHRHGNEVADGGPGCRPAGQ